VSKTIQSVASAESGGASCIKLIYPLLDGGRFLAKRIGAAHDRAVLFRCLA
jgi:hypothetical protein